MMDPKEREEFILLTEKALREDDPDRLIECLMERDPYIRHLLKNDPHVFGDEMEECLEREMQVLERLEQERKDIIEKIDNLSKNKKAIRMYSSKFPLPSMPIFFNITG